MGLASGMIKDEKEDPSPPKNVWNRTKKKKKNTRGHIIFRLPSYAVSQRRGERGSYESLEYKKQATEMGVKPKKRPRYYSVLSLSLLPILISIFINRETPPPPYRTSQRHIIVYNIGAIRKKKHPSLSRAKLILVQSAVCSGNKRGCPFGVQCWRTRQET